MQDCIEFLQIGSNIHFKDKAFHCGLQLLYNVLSKIITVTSYVTRHEKIGLMCTKYTPSYYFIYLTLCTSYIRSVTCM